MRLKTVPGLPPTGNLFDIPGQYEEMLQRGIRLSGEDQHFFIAGRILDLKAHLPPGCNPRRIMDFGCGIGATTRYLAEAFPEAEVVGVDTARDALAHAVRNNGSPRISFRSAEDLPMKEDFDLCHANGVFHHIAPPDRMPIARMICAALRPAGCFALFENNPWNPGTRLVMSRIPFDRDAKLLSSPETRRLLRGAGFACCAPTRFLFYFPRFLAWLRFTEHWLAGVPLGAQYYVLAVK